MAGIKNLSPNQLALLQEEIEDYSDKEYRSLADLGGMVEDIRDNFYLRLSDAEASEVMDKSFKLVENIIYAALR
jgi:hypothetical protein